MDSRHHQPASPPTERSNLLRPARPLLNHHDSLRLVHMKVISRLLVIGENQTTRWGGIIDRGGARPCEEPPMEIGSDGGSWPAGVMKGLVYADWTPSGYASEESTRSLVELATTGASHVAVVATLYMEDDESDEVFVHSDRTPTDDALRAVIKRARSLGLDVAFKPHVDVLTGDYRGAIAPDDPTLWFKTYRERLLHWARLAQIEGCSSFWIGTELDSMTGFIDEWRDLVSALREIFSPQLVYAANWTDLDSPDTLALGRLVDRLGVDAYFPLAEGPGPAIEELVVAWEPWLEAMEAAADAMGRPLIITELGCQSRQGAAMTPWEYGGDAPIELTEQERYYEAALRVLPRRPFIEGLFFWAWGLGPGGPRDGSHTPRGKPAAECLRRHWTRSMSADSTGA